MPPFPIPPVLPPVQSPPAPPVQSPPTPPPVPSPPGDPPIEIAPGSPQQELPTHALVFVDGTIAQLFYNPDDAVLPDRMLTEAVPQFTVQPIADIADKQAVKVGWFHSAAGFSPVKQGPRVPMPGKRL